VILVSAAPTRGERVTAFYSFKLFDPIHMVLEALYYCGRVPSAIWDIITVFNHQGFLILDCTRKPVTIRDGGGAGFTVLVILLFVG
jgi:hypothetical protein